MKDPYRLAIHTSEDGKDLYIIYDSTKDISRQLITGEIEYYSNRRKAEAECKRRNRVMNSFEEIMNERKTQK